MKNFTINLIILNFLFASSVSAQNNWNQNCGVSVQVRTSQFQPDTIVNGDSVIVVPTVFHILTQGGAENISKSHVYRALQILNQDFNRQNSDTFDIPSPFHPVRGIQSIVARLILREIALMELTGSTPHKKESMVTSMIILAGTTQVSNFIS
ncbi:MAG: hypothetical protein IPF81_01960 [Bacteroidetes bacterium]|nr:hypothetical protein [Bacteroidota bacterium]